MYDVIIIGAGASGAAIARELSRYQGRFCVLEKEADICCGTSKANSGIVHAGFDAEEGSLMAKLNVEGNKMMEKLSKELDFSYQKNGSLVVCTNESEVEKLNELLERGKRNGVEGLQILDREELKALEPNISDEAVAALYAPTGGIVCPFGLTIAFAENAAQNGVEFCLDQEVKKIERWIAGGYRICTQDTMYETKVIVNAAGVYADVFHNMVSEKKIHITARKGEYFLLDKTAGGHVSHTVFIEFMLSQIDKILDDVSVQISEDHEQLSEYIKKLLEVMEYDIPYTSKALMEKLGLKSKEGFRRKYLRPAVDMNLICMTIPDKPNSRNQRYLKK